MSVVAKFRVNEVTNRVPLRNYGGSPIPLPVQEFESNGKTTYQGAASVKLGAVYATEETGSDEDIRFSLATPSGTIEMNITNPDALEQFQPGDEFYVRFERVPKAG